LIDEQIMKELIEEMSRRIRACLNAEGWYIKYWWNFDFYNVLQMIKFHRFKFWIFWFNGGVIMSGER
jgi:hypothetical protein